MTKTKPPLRTLKKLKILKYKINKEASDEQSEAPWFGIMGFGIMGAKASSFEFVWHLELPTMQHQHQQ